LSTRYLFDYFHDLDRTIVLKQLSLESKMICSYRPIMPISLCSVLSTRVVSYLLLWIIHVVLFGVNS